MNIETLHNSFIDGTITKEEQEYLFSYIRDNIFSEYSNISDSYISYFLATSHPDYGKPNDKGEVFII